MARDGSKRVTAAETPAGSKPVDQGPAVNLQELGLEDLARRILSRDIRPRVADVRRLAEAVLAKEDRGRKEAKQAKGKKSKRGDAGKPSGGKKRKLAKIPRPKSKK